MRSSLTFQILTYFNLWYIALFSVAELLLYIWKEMSLPYPNSYAVCDILILSGGMILELIRLSVARRGNLTEDQYPIILCLILTIICVLVAIYVILWQTYVLRVELILAGILLTFHGVELLYSFILAVGFAKSMDLS